MTKVKVIYKGELERLLGKSEDTFTASSVNDILKQIRKQYGKDAYKTAKRMLIVVDGESITLKNHYKTKLDNVTEVGFFPICGGG